MKLPTTQQCRALFEQYHVPKHIHEHCEAVQALAVSIAECLHAYSIPLDVELVRVASLMHDWMKAATLSSLEPTPLFRCVPTEEEIGAWKELRKRFAGMHESEIEYVLLKDEYPALAQFLRRLGELSKGDANRTWEERVVHYADWRMLGVKKVPLMQRMDDFYERYKHKVDLSNMDAIKKIELEQEQIICDAIGCGAEEL